MGVKSGDLDKIQKNTFAVARIKTFPIASQFLAPKSPNVVYVVFEHSNNRIVEKPITYKL